MLTILGAAQPLTSDWEHYLSPSANVQPQSLCSNEVSGCARAMLFLRGEPQWPGTWVTPERASTTSSAAYRSWKKQSERPQLTAVLLRNLCESAGLQRLFSFREPLSARASWPKKHSQWLSLTANCLLRVMFKGFSGDIALAQHPKTSFAASEHYNASERIARKLSMSPLLNRCEAFKAKMRG